MNELNLFNQDQEATMSSVEIAELTGKEHFHVLRDCDRLNANYLKMNMQPILGYRKAIDIPNGGQRNVRVFDLTKMQTFDLMTGYSAELRIKVNRRWAELEAKEQNKPALPTDYLSALKALVKAEEEKALQAQQIKENKPLVNFAKAVEGTVTSIDVETFAKVIFNKAGIRMGRNRLMKWFRFNGFLTKYNKPYQFVIDRGLMKLKEGTYINRSTNESITYTQTRITGKGQIYFLNKIIDERL